MTTQNRPLFRKLGLGILAAVACFTLVGCNNDKQKAEIDRLTLENQELRNNADRLQQQADNCDQTRKSLESQLAAKPAMDPYTGGGGRPTTGGGGGGGSTVITVAGDALFLPGSASVRKEAKAQLDKIARELNGQWSGHPIQVVGHTDSDPLKKSKAKWGDNDNLSRARAQSVADYLASKGVSKSRMSVDGMGSSQPKGDKKSSRRVEIKVLEK